MQNCDSCAEPFLQAYTWSAPLSLLLDAALCGHAVQIAPHLLSCTALAGSLMKLLA